MESSCANLGQVISYVVAQVSRDQYEVGHGHMVPHGDWFSDGSCFVVLHLGPTNEAAFMPILIIMLSGPTVTVLSGIMVACRWLSFHTYAFVCPIRIRTGMHSLIGMVVLCVAALLCNGRGRSIYAYIYARVGAHRFHVID